MRLVNLLETLLKLVVLVRMEIVFILGEVKLGRTSRLYVVLGAYSAIVSFIHVLVLNLNLCLILRKPCVELFNQGILLLNPAIPQL